LKFHISNLNHAEKLGLPIFPVDQDGFLLGSIPFATQVPDIKTIPEKQVQTQKQIDYKPRALSLNSVIRIVNGLYQKCLPS
jgi:hypothetical protein